MEPIVIGSIAPKPAESVETIAAPVGVTSSASMSDSTMGTPRTSSAVAGAGIGKAPCAQVTHPRPSGSGDAMLRGRAQRQRFELRGDGDVDASGLRGSSAELQTSGASDVQLNVADTLAVRSSGSGDIRYAGSPSVDRRGLDSGSLRRRD